MMTPPSHRSVRLPRHTVVHRWTGRVVFTIAAAGLIGVIGASGVAQRSGNSNPRVLPESDSSNFMPFDQITRENVHQLEVAWHYPHAAPIFSPVVADGVLYGFGRNTSSLVALDATTGQELWIHEGLNGLTPKGINFWQSEDGRDRRLLFTIDSFLQAIDARTGQSISSFGTNGVVDLREGIARAEGTSAQVRPHSPGRIWRNTLVLGGQAGEGYLSPPGDIRAYDVVTGARLWQFHVIPQPGEFGYETNPPEGYKYLGGANNWGEMSLDEARGIVYIPTGSHTYDFYGADRPGDNLFGTSLLALDVRTGKRLWHFQMVRHDLWDYDNTAAPQLVTVTHDGRRIDAVAQAGKTGFLYVFDRVTGEPLWPIEDRPVPQSDVPGERSSPTQPFPTKPAPFAKQSFTVDDLNPWLLSPAEYNEWRERIAKARNGTGPQGGLFIPPAVNEDTIQMPGNAGGANWGMASANPDKGLVYVVNINMVAVLKLEDVRTRGGGRGGQIAPEWQQGQALYKQLCIACHGPQLQSVLPDIPSLAGVTDRLSEDAIRAILQDGRGRMQPIPDLGMTEVTALMAYLTNPTPGRGGGGGGRGRGAGPAGPPLPPGPVVASGGAPRPTLPPRGGGPSYPGGGTPWPSDIDQTQLPATRYMTGYNTMSNHTAPPYTTLTAYDLNTGEIRWQIAPGDHFPTIAAGGPRGTGGMTARAAVLVTKTGLLFQGSGDNKVRVFDEDTGRELWSAPVPGSTRGTPVMYEAGGRQYFVITSPATVGDTNGAGVTVTPETPRGYIAFALPNRP